MKQKQRLAYLFKQYYQNKISLQEKEEMKKLLETTSDVEISALMKQIWDEEDAKEIFFKPGDGSKMLANILNHLNEELPGVQPKPVRRIYWRRIAVAAAVLILVAAGGIFLLKNKTSNKLAAVEKIEIKKETLVGKQNAVLTLANGSKVLLDSNANGSKLNQGGVTLVNANGYLTYKEGKTINKVLFNTISIPRGGQYKVVLSDGSKVWLNALSSLKYPTAFTEEMRVVELTGEGYFEVAKNAKQPFLVKVDGLKVQVLGTRFNVMAYKDEENIRTTLAEGSVKVMHGQTSATIRPGQQAIWSASSNLMQVSDADLDQVLSWKRGLISFTSSDVRSIMRQIARVYDVDVQYKGDISKKRFNGIIDCNLELMDVLEVLRILGIHSNIDGRVITILPEK